MEMNFCSCPSLAASNLGCMLVSYCVVRDHQTRSHHARKTLTLDFETYKKKIKEKNVGETTFSLPMDQHKHFDILVTNRRKKHNLKLTFKHGYKHTSCNHQILTIDNT